MISLPPGCSVAYGIVIDIDQLTPEMIEWYELIGGAVTSKNHWLRNKEVKQPMVAYNSKPCHYLLDGSKGVRLHFLGKDASTASVFILKFLEHIVKHNLKEIEEYVY
jgi:hypothetical protein